MDSVLLQRLGLPGPPPEFTVWPARDVPTALTVAGQGVGDAATQWRVRLRTDGNVQLEVVGYDLRMAGRPVFHGVANPWLAPDGVDGIEAFATSARFQRVDLWLKVPNALLEHKTSMPGWSRPGREGDFAWLSLGVVRGEGYELRLNHLGLAAGAETQAVPTIGAFGSRPDGANGRLPREYWWQFNAGSRDPVPFNDVGRVIGDRALKTLYFSGVPDRFVAGLPHAPAVALSSAVERLLGAVPFAKPGAKPPAAAGREQVDPLPDDLVAFWEDENGPWRLVLERPFSATVVAQEPFFRASPDHAPEDFLLQQRNSADGEWELRVRTLHSPDSSTPQPFRRAWQTWISTWGHPQAAVRSLLFELDPPAAQRPCRAVATRCLGQTCEMRYRVVLGSIAGRVEVGLAEDVPLGLDGLGRDEWGLVFPHLKTHEAETLAGFATLTMRDHAESRTIELTISDIHVDRSQTVRLGAVDVEVGGRRSNLSAKAIFSFDFVAPRPGIVSRLIMRTYKVGGKRSTVGDDRDRLQLPLRRLHPGGVRASGRGTPPPDSAPLLFSVGDPDSDDKALGDASLWLTLKENGAIGERREIRLGIERDQTARAASPQSTLFLGTSPFLVALIRHPRIDALAAGSGNELAYWTNDGSAVDWQWRAAGEGFTLVLPPQGLGEAMEKTSKDVLYRGTEAVDDIAIGEPVDIRFPPATVLTLGLDELRRYGGTPWDLPRLLDSLREHALAGLPLTTADFEMLYGLRFKLDHVPYLRMAELFSRLGTWLDALDDRPPPSEHGSFGLSYQAFVAKWTNLRRLLAMRLGVYEVFDDRQADFGEQAEPIGLQLSDTLASPHPTVTARLRRSARLKASFLDAAEAEAHIPNYDDGLAGSFAWAFESPLLYNALWNPPPGGSASPTSDVVAVKATLARLFFSALGGWATQSADFDNGKATITATVEMGRVSELKVERLGRIGAFWNRAKLVTIFRRTVLPTPQFAAQQDRHYGRPILRKVEEYVEFIEQTRRFPDSREKDAHLEAGAVVALSCVERIPVDSRWGTDVYAEGDAGKRGPGLGWYLPLYRPGVNDLIYGRANVLVQLRADPESGRETVDCRVASLERLRFWTDVTPETNSNTEVWPPIVGIDYPLIEAVGPLPDAEAFGTEPIDARTAPFSLRLDRSADKANLVGHLPGTGVDGRPLHIGSALQYVTVHRGLPDAAPVLSAEVKGSMEWEQNATAALEHTLVALEQVGAPGTLAARAKDLLDQLENNGPLQTLTSALATRHPDMLKVCDRVEANVQWTLERAEKQILGVGSRLSRELDRLYNGGTCTLRSAIDEAIDAASAGIDGSVGELYNLVDRATAAVSQFEDEAQSKLDGMRSLSATIAALRQSLSDVAAQVAGGVDGASAVVARLAATVDADIAAAKTLLERFDNAAQALATTIGRVANHGWLRNVPHRLAVTPMIGWLTRLRDQVDAALQSEIRLLTQLRGLLEQGDSAIQKQFQAVGDEWKANLDSVTRALDAIVADATTELNTAVESATAAACKALAKLRELLPSPSLELDALRDALQKQAIDSSQATFQAVRDRLEATIDRVFFHPTAENGPRPIEAMRQKIAEQVKSNFCAPANELMRNLDAIAGEMCDKLGELRARWENLLSDARTTEEHIARELTKARKELQQEFRQAADRMRQDLKIPKPNFTGIPVLKLPHAWGTVPTVPALDFSGMANVVDNANDAIKSLGLDFQNRFRSVRYQFERDLGVAMTPIVSFVDAGKKALGDAERELKLKALALKQQVSRLRDRVESDAKKMANQMLREALPDFSGLNLENLLGPLKLGPELAQQLHDKVHTTHDFDRHTGAGFVDALVDDVAIGQQITVFSFGPVSLVLEDAHLHAHSRIARLADGQTRTEETASLRANWIFVAGSTRLMRYEQATLAIDNGKVHMDLDPSRLRLEGALDSIAGALKQWGREALPLPEGMPPLESGQIESGYALSLQAPDLAFGIFSFSQLSLGAFFKLRLKVGRSLEETTFSVLGGLNIASPEAPFTFTMSFMGGCGWLAFYAEYRVFFAKKAPVLLANIDVGFGAAAATGFDVGWAVGSVMFSFNFRLLIVRAADPALNQTFFELSLVIVGRLMLVAYIDVFLAIRLAITYSSDGGMVGTGTISVSIKICWCFTFHLHRSFHYQLKRGSNSASLPQPAWAGALASAPRPILRRGVVHSADRVARWLPQRDQPVLV